MALRILHTSDWHLGHRLYGRRRDAEHEAVLRWLLDLVCAHAVDVLMVCGDVFDTGAPSVAAQEQYYGFLQELRQTGCRHAVILAGNHDSPSFLAAPKGLLRALGVYVITAPQPLVLTSAHGDPELAVAAVPYLRERDVRTAMPGARLEDKAAAWVRGVAAVYAEVMRSARSMAPQAPAVALGHLFVAGSQVADGQGMRFAVGGVDRVPVEVFPACTYVALGHVHGAQEVAGRGFVRYSGAPLALGFADAGKAKSATLVTVEGEDSMTYEVLAAPSLQPMARLCGPLAQVEADLQRLVEVGGSVWVEAEVTSPDPADTVRRRIEEAVSGSAVDVLCVRVPRPPSLALGAAGERLEELSPEEVFRRLLDAHAVEEDLRPQLTAAFAELMDTVLQREDQHAP
ncbi:MAG: exonuclease SbcCD subunit D C-terminal domain-containing protein [Desulfomicrobiaceae bacterium]|nr:exonuclease SbcCD subunit D C-terminal domain-containing protein [Desulfomicrobiaceae bacterium]